MIRQNALELIDSHIPPTHNKNYFFATELIFNINRSGKVYTKFKGCTMQVDRKEVLYGCCIIGEYVNIGGTVYIKSVGCRSVGCSMRGGRKEVLTWL